MSTERAVDDDEVKTPPVQTVADHNQPLVRFLVLRSPESASRPEAARLVVDCRVFGRPPTNAPTENTWVALEV